MTDTRAFKAAMVLANKTMDHLAEALGISRTTLSNKVNNKSEFTASEISALSSELNLDGSQQNSIFFKK